MNSMRLRELRKEKGLTQVQLAELMGCSQPTVCGWETGASMPMAVQLPKLAALFGCTIDDLFRQPEQEQERG